MYTKGDHDIYKIPEDFFGLVLDCREHYKPDWWWGGINAKGEGDPEILSITLERNPKTLVLTKI